MGRETKIELRDAQKVIVREEIARANLLVIAPMGAGKTFATLMALTALVYKGEVKNVLIVAPKRVAMSVWQQEAEKYTPDLNVKYCKDGIDLKLFMLSPGNHHIAVVSVSHIHEVIHGCWDMVVADESTLFGNKMSQRSKEMRRICNKVPRRICLTGTPIHGGYEKLWHQIFLLDGGKALGKSLQAFRSTYMMVKYQVNGVVTVYEINPLMVPSLKAAIKPLVLNVPDVVKLPPILEKNIKVCLPKKRLAEYKELDETSIIAFKAESGMTNMQEERAIIAFSASARGMKLRQLASGFAYTADTNDEGEAKLFSKTTEENYVITHTEKIEALKEIVETAPRGVMVAYQFKSELAELRKRFPGARTLDTAEDIAAWNRGDIPIILVHPASAGWGLNLQFGGNIIVWFSLTYDAELYAQLNKRIHRSGQTDSVTLVHLIAEGTIDEQILKVLKVKEKRAQEFIK